MLYFFIITFSMIFFIALCLVLSLTTGLYTFTYAIIAPFFVNAYVLVVMGIVALIMKAFPKKIWNPRNKIYLASKKEIYFIVNKLKVKTWKDRIPEMGSTSGFPKKHIESLEKKYIWKFLQETCYAEIMHYTSGLLGFTVLFFMTAKDLIFTLPLLFINLALHVLPSITQRYNRYRLLQVYERIKN